MGIIVVIYEYITKIYEKFFMRYLTCLCTHHRGGDNDVNSIWTTLEKVFIMTVE